MNLKSYNSSLKDTSIQCNGEKAMKIRRLEVVLIELKKMGGKLFQPQFNDHLLYNSEKCKKYEVRFTGKTILF